MFEKGQLKSLGIATGLILLNVALIWVLAFTPLAGVNDLLFGTFFLLGVIVYGVMLTLGTLVAKHGVRREDTSLAVIGTLIVQFAYGMFGAGILGILPASLQAVALGATAVITTSIAILAGLVVFGTDHDFSSWGKYANYLFLGVLGVSLVGSFSPSFIALAFLLALTGFIVYLVYEIYQTKVRPGKPFLNAIGLYVAYTGVFVEILQIVVRSLMEE